MDNPLINRNLNDASNYRTKAIHFSDKQKTGIQYYVIWILTVEVVLLVRYSDPTCNKATDYSKSSNRHELNH